MSPPNVQIRSVVERHTFIKRVISGISIFGVTLVISDGVLTPAQSVLGAVQGKSLIVSTARDLANSVLRFQESPYLLTQLLEYPARFSWFSSPYSHSVYQSCPLDLPLRSSS